MTRLWLALSALLLCVAFGTHSPACCPAPASGQAVVNADQTVVILWDAATKTQHFIRQASFKSEADDFGFLIPTPTAPELEESGNEVFPFLRKLTEPEVIRERLPRSSGCGCGDETAMKGAVASPVRVLEEKRVAGFDATLLETDSATELAAWLKEHGYAFSPEVEAWAEPYVDRGWKFTALKVAKEEKGADTVDAAALRISFQTEQPIFPYREPDSQGAAEALSAKERLLRIYFLADERFQGTLTADVAWTGKVAWAGPVRREDRATALELLKLPDSTGPAEWFLTEFEDNWPYRVAPADLTFARDETQENIRRAPVIEYVSSPWPSDPAFYAFAAMLLLRPFRRQNRR